MFWQPEWKASIFRVKWQVAISRWCDKFGLLKLIGQFSCEVILLQTKLKVKTNIYNVDTCKFRDMKP